MAVKMPGSGHSPVLCVDDEALFLEGTRRLLERHGHRVITACNGREALALLEQGMVCKVLVTDIRMPEVSGEELIEQVLNLYPDLGIIVLSGEVTEEKHQEWRACGVREVLKKPVVIGQLEAAIHRAAS